jgi:hypothetical protein
MLRLLAISLATALVVAITGCGTATIDSGKAEGLVKKVAAGSQTPLKSVSCPEDVKAKKGADFDCDLVFADGTKAKLTIHQDNDSGSISTDGKTDLHIQGQ